MLAGSGEVKVADFGLARVQGDGGANLTQVGVTMGTPLYMSPEQIEGRELDSRSDIYSLGVTAYHMLAGEPPFAGDSPLAVAVQHLNQPPAAARERRPDVPPRLAQVVERMMAKKPDERFSDPAALLVELHAVATEGAEQGWATGLDHAALSQILHAADQRSVATTRLDELMKTTAIDRQKRTSKRRLAAGILGCAFSAPPSPSSPVRSICGAAPISARTNAIPSGRNSIKRKMSTPKPPGGPSSTIFPMPARITTILPNKASCISTFTRRNTTRPSSRSKSWPLRRTSKPSASRGLSSHTPT